jgi:hypothetical protein
LSFTKFKESQQNPYLASIHENQYRNLYRLLKLEIWFLFNMSAIKGPTEKSSGRKSLLIISSVLATAGLSLFGYLMVYTAPETVMERVEIIKNTSSGCIAETMDGFAINIGPCTAQDGEFIMAPVDQKIKQRAAAMNPTS